MSDLQLTLIGIGAGLLLSVWAFNRFQEWRWHRMARSTLGSERPDVLLGEDPGLGDPDAPAPQPLQVDEPAFAPQVQAAPAPAAALAPVAVAAGEAEESARADELEFFLPDEAPPAAEPGAAPAAASLAPAAAAEANTEAPVHAPAAVAELDAEPDPEIEYLVPLGCTAPVTGVALWQQLAKASAPVRGARWLGRRVTDGGWSVVQPDSAERFDSLRAALLLANRSGPVSELDLERFCSLVSALATSLQLRAEFPPRAPALQRAEQLDRFCAEVDIVVGINVVPPGNQSAPAGRIARWAENHGMVLQRDGSFHLRNAQGRTVWRLVNRDPRPFSAAGLAQMTVSGVTFLLDVPQVEAASDRLSPMFDAAATLAHELGARVLDDNGAVLGPQQLGRIARELGGLLARMDAQNIPAGGDRALRLFSN